MLSFPFFFYILLPCPSFLQTCTFLFPFQFICILPKISVVLFFFSYLCNSFPHPLKLFFSSLLNALPTIHITLSFPLPIALLPFFTASFSHPSLEKCEFCFLFLSLPSPCSSSSSSCCCCCSCGFILLISILITIITIIIPHPHPTPPPPLPPLPLPSPLPPPPLPPINPPPPPPISWKL